MNENQLIPTQSIVVLGESAWCTSSSSQQQQGAMQGAARSAAAAAGAGAGGTNKQVEWAKGGLLNFSAPQMFFDFRSKDIYAIHTNKQRNRLVVSLIHPPASHTLFAGAAHPACCWGPPAERRREMREGRSKRAHRNHRCSRRGRVRGGRPFFGVLTILTRFIHTLSKHTGNASRPGKRRQWSAGASAHGIEDPGPSEESTRTRVPPRYSIGRRGK